MIVNKNKQTNKQTKKQKQKQKKKQKKNKKTKRIYRIVDFAIPLDLWVKIKENKNGDKFLDLART